MPPSRPAQLSPGIESEEEKKREALLAPANVEDDETGTR